MNSTVLILGAYHFLLIPHYNNLTGSNDVTRRVHIVTIMLLTTKLGYAIYKITDDRMPLIIVTER